MGVRTLGKAGLRSCHMRSLTWLQLNVSPGYGLKSLAWITIQDCSVLRLASPSAPEQAGSVVACIHPRQNSLKGPCLTSRLAKDFYWKWGAWETNPKPRGLVWSILGVQRYCPLHILVFPNHWGIPRPKREERWIPLAGRVSKNRWHIFKTLFSACLSCPFPMVLLRGTAP